MTTRRLFALAAAVILVCEDGQVQVVQAGPTFKLLATNSLGANCLATPAISDGVIFFRTQEYLAAVGE